MNKYAIALLLLFSCTSCMQKYVYRDRSCDLMSINIIDREGMSETTSNPDRLAEYQSVDFLRNQPYQKVLRIYGRDLKGDTRAIITSYHPNGQVKQYLEVVNNRAFGSYREWYADSTPKLEATVIGGDADLTSSAEYSWLFDGACLAWDENQHLEANIEYSKGVLQGVSTYFHTNGKVWKKVPFVKGKIEGQFEVFLETGELLQTYEYVNNVKHGPSTRFWDGGTRIAAEECYQNGDLISGTYYDYDNTCISTITNGTGVRPIFGKRCIAELHEYKDGVPDGTVKVFSSDHTLIRTYQVKNGIKHGEEIEFYPPRMVGNKKYPLLSINWYEGKIQGRVKTWYDNGTQESQREMSNNLKMGLSTAWYRDGSLMLIEEYDSDKLVKGEYYKMGEKYPTTLVDLGSGIATLHDGEGNFLHKVSYENGKPAN